MNKKTSPPVLTSVQIHPNALESMCFRRRGHILGYYCSLADEEE